MTTPQPADTTTPSPSPATAPAGAGQTAADVTCEPCRHADEHGWFGSGTDTHCRSCHRSWSRTSKQAHCVGCCEHFASNRAADAHRDGTTCRPPADVADTRGRERFTCRDHGRGPVWSLAFYGTRPTHWGTGNPVVDDVDQPAAA